MQMIQAVITRLAAQSTTIKGWCVTVAAALLGFGASAATPVIALVAIYVIVAFALLDGYYLSLERAYRALYNQAICGEISPWTLQVQRPGLREVARAILSPVIVILYGASLLVALTVSFYLAIN